MEPNKQHYQNIPHKHLVIDLDGTLVKTDTLLESMVIYLRQNPSQIFNIFLWISKGKVYFKSKISEHTNLDPNCLPYCSEVLALIQKYKSEQCKIILATAAHHKIAQSIADHLGVFDEVFATHQGQNLRAHNKQNLLLDKYGEGNYDYVGNSKDDIPVLATAHLKYVANPDFWLRRIINQRDFITITPKKENRLILWFKALRWYQWIKNILIILPLISAHEFQSLVQLPIWVAFLSFCMAASSGYILNDILDIFEDRNHPDKKERPFAKGVLPISQGIGVSTVLIIFAVISSFYISTYLAITVLVYYITTLSYSFFFKRKMLIDVFVLAFLYALRVTAGIIALQLDTTPWLIAFCLFTFLSLAFAKRYSELYNAFQKKGKTILSGRNYHTEDLMILKSFGVSSSYISALVLALYIQHPEITASYANPTLLWLIVPVWLYWISRMWMVTARGNMNSDPILFVAKDKIGYTSFLIMIALFIISNWRL